MLDLRLLQYSPIRQSSFFNDVTINPRDTMNKIDFIEHRTGNFPDAAVIWLHGLGADGNDFLPIVKELHLPAELSIRFIFPNAPTRPITINQGYQMPGWYDISSLQITDKEDVAGITESSQAIAELCQQQETAGISHQRIILAGFSQGGAIALHCGLQYPKALGGIMALSTYLPQCVQLEHDITQAGRATPVFMAHGLADDVVDHNYGLRSLQQLQAAGVEVEWHNYPMAHSVCMDEIQDIRHWLLQKLTNAQ